MAAIKPIIFKLNGEEYGIDIAMVNAIEQVQRIVKVPNAPGYIRGIINLRGEIVPVYSLRQKFGFPEQTASETKLVVLNINQISVAIEVDEVSEITDIEAVDVSPVPSILEGAETAYMHAIAKVKQNMVIIIEPRKLMSLEEQSTVRAFVENQE